MEALTFLALAPPHTPVPVATPPNPVTKATLDSLDALVVEPPPAPEAPKPEPPPVPEAPPPPKPEPPPPPKPPVSVGAFDTPTPAQGSVAPKTAVQSTGFDAPQAAAPDLKLQTAQTGLFGDGSPQARPGTDQRGSVASSGFEPGQARQAQTVRGQVTTSGFGSGSAPATGAAKPAGTVQAAGFGDTTVSRPAAPVAAAPKPAVPPSQVEVIAKPTPAYTDEARAAKIEGDVVLEVIFAANRQVKVVRVVRGLGHGLDDMARAAAEKITFKPATQSGEPVDVRATVTIVFRLT